LRRSSGSFWAAERTWQKDQIAEGFEIDVVEPKQVGGGLFSKTFTTYKVTSTDSAEGVWRRYSDFSLMRDVLVSRFHGMAVPMLPDKRAVGNLDAAFIEARRAGLADWCRKVASNPYLRGDATFRRFLSISGDKEWEQAQKAATAGVGAAPGDNEGLARWFSCLRQYPMPADGEDAISQARETNETIEKHLRNLLEATDGFLRATKAAAESMNLMAGSLEGLGGSTTALADTMGPVHATLRTETLALGDLSAKSHTAWKELVSLSSYADNEIQLFLMAAIANEIARCQAFRALLEVRKSSLDAFARAGLALNQVRFRHKQLADKGDTARASKLEPDITQAAEIARGMKARLDDVTKGALLVESRNSATKRVRMLTQLFGCFATSQASSASSAMSAWSKFLAEAGLDKTATLEKAQRIIDSHLDTDEYDAVLPGPPDEGFDVAPVRPPPAAAAPAPAAAAPAAAAAPTPAPAAAAPAPAAAAPAPAPAADAVTSPASGAGDDEGDEGDML